MIYKKTGYPEESDLVMCTVKKILFHSVFVILDEYDQKEGMIHISEVAPGRIRNIRDFVKENKKIVCKVLRIDKEKGHVDLSLRRVNNSERINKTNEYKQEQKAERLLESIGKSNNKTLEEMYSIIGSSLIDNYGSLREAFQAISSENSRLKEFKLQKKLEESIINQVNEKIKAPEVKIHGIFTLRNNKPNGIDIIKEVFTKIKTKNIIINYISAPKYRVVLSAPDYKTAENQLKQLKEKFFLLGKECQCETDFIRSD